MMVEPESRTDLGLAWRSQILRTVTSLGGAEPASEEPIRWQVKDADGFPLHDTDGHPNWRDVGLSFLSPRDRAEFPWADVVFDNSFALERQKPDGSSDWETRDLPFQVTDRTPDGGHTVSGPAWVVSPVRASTPPRLDAVRTR